MNVLIAGGTGTIGVPLAGALVKAGHQVTALSRSTTRHAELRALGASVVIADALNRDAVIRAVANARPTHVVHQLTALPKDGPRSAHDLEATNRLRIEGTKNLLHAAITAGVRRFVAGSFAVLPEMPTPASSDQTEPAAAAVASMENQVLDATTRGAIEGVVLRYGLFYGSGVPSTVAMVDLVRRRRLPIIRGDAGQLPFIHLDDAVSATVRALDHGLAGNTYDIVDDRPLSITEVVETIAEYTGAMRPFNVPAWIPRLFAPYMARMTSVRLSLSNEKAKSELGWQPAYPTVRDGMARMLRQAA
jgi:nucleoside-diphosphate-sugar epimerase